MRKIILFMAAMAAASPVQAQGARDSASTVPTRRVTIDGLDLSRPADLVRFRQRIAAAVEEVCGSYAVSDAWMHAPIRNCRRQAFARAEIQVARLLNRAVELAASRQRPGL